MKFAACPGWYESQNKYLDRSSQILELISFSSPIRMQKNGGIDPPQQGSFTFSNPTIKNLEFSKLFIPKKLYYRIIKGWIYDCYHSRDSFLTSHL